MSKLLDKWRLERRRANLRKKVKQTRQRVYGAKHEQDGLPYCDPFSGKDLFWSVIIVFLILTIVYAILG